VRGTTVDVALTGADTAFASGTSVASVSGSGVQVVSTTVSSPTSVVARLKIAGNAPLGFRDLKVTAGAQDASLLDGFEVTAVPQAPTGPAPAASASSASGRPSTRSDRSRPTAALLKGKRGASATHGKLLLHGRASDTGCVAAISVAGKVVRVEVAISRKSGRKCRFLTAAGGLTKARSCSKPVWLKAKGTTAWTFATKRRLPRGTYAIQVRARDAAGNRQAAVATRTQKVG
jgi:hypothetical protein